MKVIIAIVLMFLMTSCLYRMPTDEDFNTVPMTNNPGLIRGSGEASLMPGVNY